jgi:hypothetical protein
MLMKYKTDMGIAENKTIYKANTRSESIISSKIQTNLRR